MNTDKLSRLNPPPGSWGVLLNLDAPFLLPQAVQFALFSSDPVLHFTQLYHEKLPQVQAALGFHCCGLGQGEQQRTNKAFLATCWDQGFRKITGDAIYLLTSAPPDSQGSAKRSTGIFSSSPGGFQWLATKTIVLADQTPICWCLPLYIEPGQKTELTLSVENYLDLTTLV